MYIKCITKLNNRNYEFFKKKSRTLNNKNSVSKNLSKVFGVLLITIAFFSCETNDDIDPINIGETLSYNDIQGFFETNGVQDQNFTIDASTGGSVTGDDGTVVIFPPNAFVDGSNNPVTGIVDVAIKEIFTPSQMILSNKPTNAISFLSENTFLLSEGETEVKISQNGNAVQLATGANYQISVPSAGGFDPEMLPFSGTTTPEEGIVWGATGDTGSSGNSVFVLARSADPSS